MNPTATQAREQKTRPPARCFFAYSYRGSVNSVSHAEQATVTTSGPGLHSGEHQRLFRAETGRGLPHVSHGRAAAAAFDSNNRKHAFVQNVRVRPFRLAFSTSKRRLVYDAPHPSQVKFTLADASRQAREHQRGEPGSRRSMYERERIVRAPQR